MKKISFGLSVSEIQQAIKQIEEYKKELNRKTDLFVQKLAQYGITVCEQNIGNYGRHVSFTMEVNSEGNEHEAILVAQDIDKIISVWETKDGTKSAEVSALLMAEFGSGAKSENPLNVPGVGQGTFPGQTHAFDKQGWYWKGQDDKWHHTYGSAPTLPMYKATRAMKDRVLQIAREVYK